MNTNLLTIVKHIAAEYGEEVLGDAKRLKAFFGDLAKAEPEQILKQIGVGAGAVEHHTPVFLVNSVYKQPVRFNMTFPFALPRAAVQDVIVMPCTQGLFVDEHSHYFNEFIHVFSTLFHAGKFFLESIGTLCVKHSLTPQVGKKFVKGMKSLRRNLPAEHRVALGKSGHRLGVVGRLPRPGVVIFGAEGADVLSIHRLLPRRLRGNDNLHPRPAHRQFQRKHNGQPAVGGYVNSLFNNHEEKYSVNGGLLKAAEGLPCGSSFFRTRRQPEKWYRFPLCDYFKFMMVRAYELTGRFHRGRNVYRFLYAHSADIAVMDFHQIDNAHGQSTFAVRRFFKQIAGNIPACFIVQKGKQRASVKNINHLTACRKVPLVLYFFKLRILAPHCEKLLNGKRRTHAFSYTAQIFKRGIAVWDGFVRLKRYRNLCPARRQILRQIQNNPAVGRDINYLFNNHRENIA
jgi:hypothetical protein